MFSVRLLLFDALPITSLQRESSTPQSSVSSPPQYFIEESKTNYRGTGASSRVLAGTEGRFVRDGYKEGEQSVRLQGIPAGPAQSDTETQAGRQ